MKVKVLKDYYNTFKSGFIPAGTELVSNEDGFFKYTQRNDNFPSDASGNSYESEELTFMISTMLMKKLLKEKDPYFELIVEPKESKEVAKDSSVDELISIIGDLKEENKKLLSDIEKLSYPDMVVKYPTPYWYFSPRFYDYPYYHYTTSVTTIY